MPPPNNEEPRPALSLGLALAVLTCALLASLLPRGLPADGQGVRAWDGLGPWVDTQLPHQGLVVLEHQLRSDDGRESILSQRSSLGGELVSVLIYALAIAPALLILRRRGRPLRFVPSRADCDRVLTVLAWLIPAYLAIALVAGLIAAHVDEGVHLKRAVYGFALPSLVTPNTAAIPILRLAILAPLAEELIWRGVVYRGLRSRLSFGPASLITAFTFGVWHVLSGWTEPAALASQYLFALLACWLVERGRSLGGAILLHALGNTAALALYATAMLAPQHVLAAFGLS